MSGNIVDWFKFRKKLYADPRTIRIASRFRNAHVTQAVTLDTLCELAALGALAKFWGFADTHVSDDNTLSLSADEVNKIVGVANFCEFLPADWLQILDAERVHLPDFLNHNGPSAKQRAMGAVRQARYRHGGENTVTHVSRKPLRKSDAPVTREPSPEENRLDIRKDTPLPPSGLDAAAWGRWVEYRQQIKKPIKPVSTAGAMREMAALGSAQMAAVEHTIAQGWQGLQPPKANGHAPGSVATAPAVRTTALMSELIAAATAEGFRKPHNLESPGVYADELRRYRNRDAPKIDTSKFLKRVPT